MPMSYDTFREIVQNELAQADIPPHSLTSPELRAAYVEGYTPSEVVRAFKRYTKGESDSEGEAPIHSR